METIYYLNILDNILNHFYINLGKEITPFDIRNDFKISEDLFFACIEKIHKSGHLDKIRFDKRAEEKAIYKINFEGILFKENSGYVSHYEKDQCQMRIRNLKDYALIIGTWFAGIGATALVVWEVYKHYCLHIG